MAKLFELLAVEKDLATKAKATLSNTQSVFSSPDNFLGFTTKFSKLVEDKLDLQDENRPLPNNVDAQLDIVENDISNYINTTLAKEMANTSAFESVEIDGEKFFEDMSATALLSLETKLDELHKLYSVIPTLPLGAKWNNDSSLDCFVSADRKQIRTEKTSKVIVLYEATKEHPAQTQLVTTDIPAYEVERTVYAGMLTAADKRLRLERLEKLQQAVKKARQRANTVEVENKDFASKIFKYINGE